MGVLRCGAKADKAKDDDKEFVSHNDCKITIFLFAKVFKFLKTNCRWSRLAGTRRLGRNHVFDAQSPLDLADVAE